ncbi:helix-turn-helix domain-containing protein [Nocardioides sp. CFH 31398]|uniref:helix-turn-helix domain-containing protein n=1 Tax=Nocardioides sp. CFH 31398 TaxID=2919579 RepID=UPI001F06DCDD|nr:helix-turn-helix domain-containing protein [Nocardioides sp. CFH 31398]MCH1867089.1 helix-turn-helix domain-containing protein [Nocardioides sp. CFH 31398]
MDTRKIGGNLVGLLTYREAARRLGVCEATVRTLLRHGVLEQTPPPADGDRRVRAHASINPDSLDRARTWLEQRETEREKQRQRREQHGNPPDVDHVWLDTATVAAMAGLTVQWAQWMAREGKMPATFHGGQYWVRREHAEVIVAARAFAARADARG